MSVIRYRPAGEFNADTGAFELRNERIPAPPQARPMADFDPFRRSVFTGYDLKVACPKCLAPIVFQWRQETSDAALEDTRVFPFEHPMAAMVAIEFKRKAEEMTRRAELAEQRAYVAEKNYRAIQMTKSKRAKRKRRRRWQRS